MAVTGTFDVVARRRAMAERLTSNGALQLNDTAVEWGVHPMTIRRDFDVFVSQGLARRVRGGLIALRGEDFEHRIHINAPAKRVIAAKLRPLLQSNTAVALDSSTTIATFADMLDDLDGLMVLTNGLRAFRSLHGRSGVRTYLTGGEQEDQNESLVGSLAESAIQHFAIDTAFISTMSLDPDFGTSEMTMEQVAFKRTLVSSARTVVVALDSSKLATRARFRSVGLTESAILVTELDPTDTRLDPYRSHVDRVL